MTGVLCLLDGFSDEGSCGIQAQPGGGEKLLATATGIFKKLGALRAL